MSDYGFATYDERSGKKIKGSVNSKWPIFGPKYGDIKNAFRTIHFVDTVQYGLRTSPSVSLPAIDNINGEQFKTSQYHGYEKILIATIPHEYKKRPMGYATIAGSFVKNTRGRWEYENYYDRQNYFPPSANLNGIGEKSGNMLGYGGSLRPTSNTGDLSIFEMNSFSASNISYPSGPNYQVYVWLGTSYGNGFMIPGNNGSGEDIFGTSRPPYAVEIDDTNVYVYRYYYWCDVYKRSFNRNEYGYDQCDLRARMKGIIDYAGSEFDLTLYLCPYSMEDLI